MPDMTAPLKLGANLWNQYTDWPAFLEGMLRAEELGYDSLWTWDHVYPIIGDWEGPALETYTAMAAVAARTSRATIGHLVGANTFRNPALLTKMVTTIDHISGGRAVLGIGAAWMEPEHTAFGWEFGDRPGTRLRWLEEALGIVRGMLDGDAAHGLWGALSHGGRPQPAGPDPAAHPHPHRRQRAEGDAATRGPVRRHEQPGQPNRGGARATTPSSSSIAATLGRDEKTIERTVELQRVAVRDTREAARWPSMRSCWPGAARRST